jgi:two-component system chemotaxis response regulator CheY
MNRSSAGKALPTLLQVLPPIARDLAIELEIAIGQGGARTRLKLGAALAAAAALRDDELWRALAMDAGSHGESDVGPLALDAAMRFAHVGEAAPSDATTRILRLALVRAFHGERGAHTAADPLVDECANVAEIVHALAIARSVDRTAEDIDRAASFLRLPQRRRLSSRPEDEALIDAAKVPSSVPRLEAGKPASKPPSEASSSKPPSEGRIPAKTPAPTSDRDRAPISQRGAAASPVPPGARVSNPPDGRSTTPSGHPRTLRVLVVDDDEGYRKLLGRMLSPLEVVNASNGAAALELLATQGEFEVILTKLELPEVSGVELFEMVKRKWPQLVSRVVFVSAHGSAPDGQTMLRKPISRDSLLHTIGRVSKKIAEMNGARPSKPPR